ncbi:MarR family transcriptional regulator [Chitinophaga silvatica]|uniref:MarR family transcriptional regulator n=1 Tax=Chitinophaga silvatica TaxID=2282649 RepID=A0A3E1Y4I4_9BACT|nr:MarR family winged helix-turn-helix transcriptional regulator [Chitinophaga silvatica]RFS19387.1 MarR family transcriptional regulator [Chitinophaga silvatica]
MSNVIDESGILAIATRLQRLSDTFRKDGQLIYKSFGHDFEPKWFPVVYTLDIKSQLSVVEIANEIGYTHPSTISLLKELEKLKIIHSKKDKSDERKRLISLTEKGKELVAAIKPIWDLLRKTQIEILDTKNNLMKAIEEVEEQLKISSFYDRAEKNKSLMGQKSSD